MSIVKIFKLWYNSFIKFMGCFMDRIRWLNNRCKKFIRIRTKKNKNKERTKKKNNEKNQGERNQRTLTKKQGNSKSKYKKPHYTFIAPEIFSLEKNPEKTLKFFESVNSVKNKKRMHSAFFIDSENIQEIGIESLMYLTAILRDTKNNIFLKYSFKGNFPKNENAKQTFIESGFLSFVESNGKNLVPKSNKIQISCGISNDAEKAKSICKFIHTTCGFNRIQTMPLYNILVELMGNTIQHAYKDMDNSGLTTNEWFVYAEEFKEYVDFVFLDTGDGIPKTVFKKLHEKFILIGKSDAEFIQSALGGEFRTKTEQKHRGKGLNEIDKLFREVDFLQDLVIYSGRGCCRMVQDENKSKYLYEISNINGTSIGTLFKWRVNKNNKGEYND